MHTHTHKHTSHSQQCQRAKADKQCMHERLNATEHMWVCFHLLLFIDCSGIKFNWYYLVRDFVPLRLYSVSYKHQRLNAIIKTLCGAVPSACVHTVNVVSSVLCASSPFLGFCCFSHRAHTTKLIYDKLNEHSEVQWWCWWAQSATVCVPATLLNVYIVHQNSRY